MAGPSPFPPTNLDANQAVRGAYDEEKGRFRVETEATIIDGAVEVAINADSDNIAIKDPSTGATLHINPDGSINVNVEMGPPVVSTTISIYNEVTGIAIGASQLVLTYTVPGGQTLTLSRVQFSSDSNSTVEIDFNGVTNGKRRLYYTYFNTDFVYENLILAAGTVINVMATNQSTQSVANFSATLQGAIT